MNNMLKQRREKAPLPPLCVPGKKELIAGAVYLPLHMYVIASVFVFFMLLFDFAVTPIAINLMAMGFGACMLCLLFRKHLRESLMQFFTCGRGNVRILLLGMSMRYALNIALSALIVLCFALLGREMAIINPNQDAVEVILETHLWGTVLLAVVLAPIVEELLFRSLLFAPLLTFNRLAAYLISGLAFGFLHIAAFLFTQPSPLLLLTILMYLPAGIALAWAYEKSGNIITPMLLHALMNVVAIFVTTLL